MLRLSFALCASTLIVGCGLEDPENIESIEAESSFCDLNGDGVHIDPGECDYNPVPAPDGCQKKAPGDGLFLERRCPLDPLNPDPLGPLEKDRSPVDRVRPELPGQRIEKAP